MKYLLLALLVSCTSPMDMAINAANVGSQFGIVSEAAINDAYKDALQQAAMDSTSLDDWHKRSAEVEAKFKTAKEAYGVYYATITGLIQTIKAAEASDGKLDTKTTLMVMASLAKAEAEMAKALNEAGLKTDYLPH